MIEGNYRRLDSDEVYDAVKDFNGFKPESISEVVFLAGSDGKIAGAVVTTKGGKPNKSND
jgi:hypothetical protein